MKRNIMLALVSVGIAGTCGAASAQSFGRPKTAPPIQTPEEKLLHRTPAQKMHLAAGDVLRRARQFGDVGDLAQAKPLYKKAQALEAAADQSISAEVVAAEWAFTQGRYLEAASLYQGVQGESDLSALLLVVSELRSGHQKAAKVAYDGFLSKYREMDSVRGYGRRDLPVSQHDTPAALEATALLLAAQCVSSNGRRTIEERWVSLAHRLAPNNALASLRLAEFCLASQRYKQGLPLYESAYPNVPKERREGARIGLNLCREHLGLPTVPGDDGI